MDPERRRQDILQAAIAVFARKGYYTAKVSDVAHEAGIAHGTVYLYFKSKEDLLLAIFTEKMGEMIDYIQEQVATVIGAESQLKRLIQVQIELIETYPELTELILVELRQSGKFLRSEAIDQIQRYLGIIQSILEEGIAEKVFSDSLDVEVVSTILYAGIEGLATRWILEGTPYALGQAADTVTRTFLDGIRSARLS